MIFSKFLNLPKQDDNPFCRCTMFTPPTTGYTAQRKKRQTKFLDSQTLSIGSLNCLNNLHFPPHVTWIPVASVTSLTSQYFMCSKKLALWAFVFCIMAVTHWLCFIRSWKKIPTLDSPQFNWALKTDSSSTVALDLCIQADLEWRLWGIWTPRNLSEGPIAWAAAALHSPSTVTLDSNIRANCA